MNTTLQVLRKIALAAILCLSNILVAQQGINYQGVARDTNNDVLVSTNITLGLEIIKTSEMGTTVYFETHNVMTDANGVFSVVIGEGNSINDFSNINWAEDKHFLKVVLNGEEVGTAELRSVPYTKAMGKWQAHKNGVTSKGTGGSIYIGDNAGENDDFTDNNNIGIGIGALQNNSTGYENIGIGHTSLNSNTVGISNIGFGQNALYSNTSGSYNIALGNSSLNNNTSGGNNIALGFSSLSDNTLGNNNIAIGQSALSKNTSGQSNIATGLWSLSSNTEGNENIALGTFSMLTNTTGSYNVASGYRALEKNTSGDYNVAVGNNTLNSNTTGVYNVAFGREALFSNITGTNNFAVGYKSMYSNDIGLGNIAVGIFSLNKNTDGYSNIGLGGYVLRNNTSGINNIALGFEALNDNVVGNNNIAIGYQAGGKTTGSGNIFIGSGAGYNANFVNVNDLLVIDNSITSNPLIYGDFANNILSFNGKVGVGTKTPELPLQVVGGTDVNLSDGSGQVIIGSEGAANLVMDNNEIQARNNTATAILYLQNEGGSVYVGGAVAHASDRRLKRDIEDISYGLKEIMQLQPKEYFWKGKIQDYKSLGLIAQEVDEVIKNVVTYDKEVDKYGVSYTELIPVLIKAIQEQQAVIESQESKYEALNKNMEALNERLEKIELLKIAINKKD